MSWLCGCYFNLLRHPMLTAIMKRRLLVIIMIQRWSSGVIPGEFIQVPDIRFELYIIVFAT
jgi:hypothetical protein